MGPSGAKFCAVEFRWAAYRSERQQSEKQAKRRVMAEIDSRIAPKKTHGTRLVPTIWPGGRAVTCLACPLLLPDRMPETAAEPYSVQRYVQTIVLSWCMGRSGRNTETSEVERRGWQQGSRERMAWRASRACYSLLFCLSGERVDRTAEIVGGASG